MSDISRRDFLKSSLAGAAALALTGAGLGVTAAAPEYGRHSYAMQGENLRIMNQ